MIRLRFVLCLAILLLIGCVASAAVPPLISYQGKLMQPNGILVPDGTYSVRFAIYDAPVNGNTLWSEPNTAIQVKNGLFSTMLGSVINLPANIFDSPSRFFGVKVGDDPEMTPRQQIASVAFAMKAESADVAKTVPDGAITTGKIAESAVTTNKLADGVVTSTKLADAVVNTTKIVDSSVSTAKIANGAVTAVKIEPQEAWHVIGSVNQPAFENGWMNYGDNDESAKFMKDSLGFVHIIGLVKSGPIGVGNNKRVFTLPVGYRPAKYLHFATTAAAQFAEMRIDGDGSVQPEIGSNVWYSLNAIFKAEQ